MKPPTLAYASKSSDNQATRSRRSLFGRHLSRLEVAGVIVIASLVFCFGPQYPLITAVVGGVVGTAMAVAVSPLLFLLCRTLLRAWRNPAGRVARLLKKGRTEQACAMGRNLLLKHPDDPILRINVAAALYLAANLDDARQVFDAIDAKAVPPQLQPLYEDWRQRFHPQKEP